MFPSETLKGLLMLYFPIDHVSEKGHWYTGYFLTIYSDEHDVSTPGEWTSARFSGKSSTTMEATE